jgi:hypothetical protein
MLCAEIKSIEKLYLFQVCISPCQANDVTGFRIKEKTTGKLVEKNNRQRVSF